MRGKRVSEGWSCTAISLCWQRATLSHSSLMHGERRNDLFLELCLLPFFLLPHSLSPPLPPHPFFSSFPLPHSNPSYHHFPSVSPHPSALFPSSHSSLFHCINEFCNVLFISELEGGAMNNLVLTHEMCRQRKIKFNTLYCLFLFSTQRTSLT